MGTNAVVLIVIVVIALFLVWLLRKWLKRLIFIVIILVIAFFIYGLFSPSWAAKLWYNVRTFPDRVVSRFSDQTFLDYDNYKLKFSDDDSKDTRKSGKKVIDKSDENDVEAEDEVIVEKIEKTEKKEELVRDESEEDLSAQAFSDTSSIRFSDILNSKSNDDLGEAMYSQKEVWGVITQYVEENLDDDNEILVTVTYDEKSKSPEKIVLQPQKEHSSAKIKNSENLIEKVSAQKIKSFQIKAIKKDRVINVIPSEAQEGKSDEKEHIESTSQKWATTTTSNQAVSNWLSQADINEAEYILWALF